MSSDETYGSPSGSHPTTIEYAENAIVDGVSAKKVFPIVLPPTAQTNPSYVLTRNGSGYITSIAQTIGATTYTKTITRDVNNYITDISVWV